MSSSFFARFLLAFVLCSISSALGQSMTTNPGDAAAQSSGAGVRISLQGDVAGYRLAEMLWAIYAQSPDALPVQKLRVGSGSICAILEAANYPPPCEAYYPLIDRINGSSVSRRTLQDQDTVTLPDISIALDKSIRVFSKRDKSEAIQGNELLKNWKEIGAQRIERPDSFAVRFNTYELVVPAPDDDSANALFDQVIRYRSPNVLVNVLSNSMNPEPRLHSYKALPDSSALEKQCSNGTLNDRIHEGLPLFRYLELMEGDQDALAVMKSGLATAATNVPVTLVDTILDEDQKDVTASGSASWSCKWSDFIGSKHHANHLRGLIESAGPLHLFEGVADHVNVTGYSWWKPAEDNPNKLVKGDINRATQLAGLFNESYSASTPIPVFVVATEFEGYSSKAKTASGQLLGPEKRFGRQPEQSVLKARPLLIVSSGQATGEQNGTGESGEGQANNDQYPVALTPTDPHSPQNLGDLENVVVVTACSICSGNSAKLFEKAYYSGANQHMVHIAAPGAEPIVGWVDGKYLSAAGGTSQSAALVAGLAGAMISQFPNIYVSPHVVKTRLQATSRPIPPMEDGSVNPDAAKLTAGIVDPILALLDPNKNWLKQNGKWRDVAVRRWTTDSFDVGTPFAAGSININSSSVLRIVKTREADSYTQRTYSIYIDALQVQGDNSVPGATVDRTDFVTKLGGAGLLLCDGTTVALTKIDDFIVRANGIKSSGCKK